MILVTGATGLLGSHVLYELVKNKRPARALFRDKQKISFTRQVFRYYEPDDEAFNSVEWAEADINDYHALYNALKDVKQVFHCAGYVSFSAKKKKLLDHVNAEGTANVVNACIESGIEKMIHTSSIATLGEPAVDETVTESVLWNRANHASAYAVSKYKAEMEVWRGVYEDLNAVIVNPSVIIGPGMWFGPGRQLFDAVQKGISFYPPGSSGYIDVRDVARIMVKLADMPVSGERFILNADHKTHREFMELLAKHLGTKSPDIRVTPLMASIALVAETIRAFFTGSDPKIDRHTLRIASKCLFYSNEKIRKLLGFDFISIEESIEDSVRIYNLTPTLLIS